MPERHSKERVGVVVDKKSSKTIMVEVLRLVQHPAYNKVVRDKKIYPVHDEKEVAKAGDKVRIRETRPVSRTKHWRLVEVMKPTKK